MTSDVPASTASYRGLLALVIILGALIMIGVGALIAGAMLGAGRRAEVESAQPFMTAVPAPGARIESAELQGNRILMRLSGGEGDELVIVDANSGRLLGRVKVGSAP
jgi:hypothetical protein